MGHASKRQAVITGMGIVSSLGSSRAEVRDGLQAGRSGIVMDSLRKEMGFRSGLTGRIADFEPLFPLKRRYRKTLPEFGRWAWEAVGQALEQAGMTHEVAGDERCGIIFANDSSVTTAVDQVNLLKENGETRFIGSGHIFRLLNSTITLNLSTKLKLRGSSWTVSGACAGGAMAIGQAAGEIVSGRQDRMICGGAQEISWQSMCSFDGIGAFSRREEAPEQASRPFDLERDGLVPSGGAAALFLEEKECAQKRGAESLAEIKGFAATSDGHHISVPSGDGMERAMAMAIREASLQPEDIDLVMAHATSTQLGDEVEAHALNRLFALEQGNSGPVVCTVKALTGHEFWMAGASQAVYSLLMSRAGFIAGHPNLETCDSAAALLNIPRTSCSAFPIHILCNASGFGGTNACLTIKVIREG